MRLNVKVIPNSRNCEVSKIGEDTFMVRVDAPPMKGQANDRLIDILADYFNVPKYTVQIVKGFKSRNKIVEIDIL